MLRMCRLFQSYVLEERVDSSEARIPRAGAVFADSFQVVEETANKRRIEIFDAKLRGRFAEPFLRKMQKQAEAIAISRYRIRACLLLKQAIGKEGLKKRGKIDGNHGCTSRSINRSVAN